jgi:hypothetical protein
MNFFFHIKLVRALFIKFFWFFLKLGFCDWSMKKKNFFINNQKKNFL